MKENLLKKLLDELGISPITENDVSLAMKKAVGNPIYWFFFKRKNLADNINFATAMLSIACIAALLASGAFVSIMPFADKFMDNHIGLYLFFGLCAVIVVAVVSGIISTNITAWHEKTSQHMWDLNIPLKETLGIFKNALDYNSEYYRKGVRLSGQRVNKTQFVFVGYDDNSYYCVNIGAATQ